MDVVHQSEKIIYTKSCLEKVQREALYNQAHQQHRPAAFNSQLPHHHPYRTLKMSTSAPVRGVTRTCQLAARQQTRSLSSQCLRIASQPSDRRRQAIQRRWQSTDAATPTNPKIATIVDQISQLTLLETADLVASLKVWLPSTHTLSRIEPSAHSVNQTRTLTSGCR